MNTIHTIPILPMGMLNAFLVIQPGGAMLVDTGLPPTVGRIAAALRRAGLGWHDLRAVILTHGHVDHAGGAAEVARLSGAPVVVQRAELPYLQGKPMRFRRTNLAGLILEKTGLITRPVPPFQPGRIVDGVGDLGEFGLQGRLLHTPGHTPGSQSLLLDDGNVIAGDMAASGIFMGGIARLDRPMSPPFEEEPQAVSQSLRALVAAGGRQFFLGHGGPLPAEAILRHAERLERG